MMRGRDLWAVVPVKEVEHAKRRLERCYSARFRRELVHAMLEDVLRALAAAPAIAGIVVVSLDRGARAIASRLGARLIEQGARDGHTGAVMAAAYLLAKERRDAMLTLPADVPCVTNAEISTLIGMHRAAPAFTIVPSHDGRGSNAIVVSPPDAVPLAFGDDSFGPHLAAALRAGIEPTVVAMPGIALDIDHPADLDRLAQMRGAPLTQSFIAAHRQDAASEACAVARAER